MSTVNSTILRDRYDLKSAASQFESKFGVRSRSLVKAPTLEAVEPLKQTDPSPLPPAPTLSAHIKN